MTHSFPTRRSSDLANHLTYLGDAVIGSKVNVGAGTITCNYDGVNKSTTTIGDGAFIGSNSSLVAPVTIGAEATIAAGSVITMDAPAGKLTVARSHQHTVDARRRPRKPTERALRAHTGTASCRERGAQNG